MASKFASRHETLISALKLVVIGAALLLVSYFIQKSVTGFDAVACFQSGGVPIKTWTPPFISCHHI